MGVFRVEVAIEAARGTLLLAAPLVEEINIWCLLHEQVTLRDYRHSLCEKAPAMPSNCCVLAPGKRTTWQMHGAALVMPVHVTDGVHAAC